MKCGNYVELSEAKVVKGAYSLTDAICMVKKLKLPEDLRGKVPHRRPRP